MFLRNEWVIQNGQYDGLYPVVQGNSIIVPSAQIYDISGKRHWTTTTTSSGGNAHSTTTRHHHYRLEGSLLTTSRLRLSHSLFECRALKVGDRYFISRTQGPLDAAEAFSKIVNIKPKRAHQIEVLVSEDILREFIDYVMHINSSGGYGVCNIASTGGSWYAIRDWTCLGQVTQRGPHQEHTSNAYEFGKTRLPSFGGRMVHVDTTRKVSPLSTSTTVPIRGNQVEITSKTQLSIACQKQGWKIDSPAADIRRIDVQVTHIVQRPLAGTECAIKPRLSKSNCPEIVPADGQIKKGLTPTAHIDPNWPLSILGATVEQPDGHAHVRVKQEFRRYLSRRLLSTSLVPYIERAGDRLHPAGKKGTYKVYKLRLMVEIDRVWYWLDTLERSNLKPNMTKRIRYLELA